MLLTARSRVQAAGTLLSVRPASNSPDALGGVGFETRHARCAPARASPPHRCSSALHLVTTRDRSHRPAPEPLGSSSPTSASPDAPSPLAPFSSTREQDGGSPQTSLLLLLAPLRVPDLSGALQPGMLPPSPILQPRGSTAPQKPVLPGTVLSSRCPPSYQPLLELARLQHVKKPLVCARTHGGYPPRPRAAGSTLGSRLGCSHAGKLPPATVQRCSIPSPHRS